MSAFAARVYDVSNWPQDMRIEEYKKIVVSFKDMPLDAEVPLSVAATLLGCTLGKNDHANEVPTGAPVIHTVVLSDGVVVKEA